MGLGASAAGNIMLQKDMATSIGQYTPMLLPGEHLSDRESWQSTVYRIAKSQTKSKRPCEHKHNNFFLFVFLWHLCPVRVGYEGSSAAWLVGTLVAQGVQGHKLPLPQELRCYQSLFSSLSQLVIRRSLWPIFLCNSACSALRGLLCLGSFYLVPHIRNKEGPLSLSSYSVVWCIRHLKGHPGWSPTLQFSASDI